MTSCIRRYKADSGSRFLEDTGAMADPDFWSNEENGQPLPTWAVCGPDDRASLEEGGKVFFTPAKEAMPSGYDYSCSGVLVVDEKLDLKEFLASSKLETEFKSRYLRDLMHSSHLPRDITEENFGIAQKRLKNIVVGCPEKSVWFGENDVLIADVLRDHGFSEYADSVETATRQPRHLDSEAADVLYQALTDEIEPVRGSPTFQVADSDGGGC